MSANTTPEGFDPEQTSSFAVRSLTEKEAAFAELAETNVLTNAGGQLVIDERQPTGGPSFEILRSGPAVYYQHSDGRTITDADLSAPAFGLHSESDRLRELMLARALLRHALHLVDKELNQVGPV